MGVFGKLGLSGLGRLGFALLAGVAAPPPVGGAYAGVDAATLIQASLRKAEWTGQWAGYDGSDFFSDQIVTSWADLDTKYLALVPAPGRWFRLRLDSSQPQSTWSSNKGLTGSTFNAGIHVTGHYFGGNRDHATGMGGVLIESSDPLNPVLVTGALTLSGLRGAHFRNIIFAGPVAAGPSGSQRDAAVAVTIQSNGTNREAGVYRFENCPIGNLWGTNTDELLVGVGFRHASGPQEQVDIIDCRFKGCQTGISAVGIRRLRTFRNDYQKIIGDASIITHTQTLVAANSNWDEVNYWWNRGHTSRNWIDNKALSHEHSDNAQTGTSGDVGGSKVLHEFCVAGGRRLSYTDGVTTTFSAQPADGSSLTVGGTVFTFVASGATGTQVNIGASISATYDNLLAVFNANLPTGANRITKTSSNAGLLMFEPNQFTAPSRSTSPASNITFGAPTRYAGGTQGFYNDDSSYNLDVIVICCMAMANDGIGSRLYNGRSIIDRSTFARPGLQPDDATVGASGFNSSYDYVPYVSVDAKTAGTTVDITIRNTVLDYVADEVTGVYGSPTGRTADGTYSNGPSSVALANNRYVKWAKTAAAGTKPGDLLAGAFTTDAFGRVTYTLDETGGNTQQQFREAVYAQLKLANGADRAAIGPTDPATWISELAA